MGLPAVFKRNKEPERGLQPLPFDEWLSYFNYGGSLYPLLNQTLVANNQESIDGSFCGNTRGALKASGVVAACMFARLQLFSEARFQFRRLSSSGRPGDLFGTADLAPLENPWPGGTTGDLLARAIMDVDLAGNFYLARRTGNRLKRLRPDWTWIVLGSTQDASVEWYDIDAEIVGYLYYPGGKGQGEDPELLAADEVAHFAPIPDPEAVFRGMSWLTPVINEILADRETTEHKRRFFQNGATPNLLVKMDISDPEKFRKWVDLFKEQHEGQSNAFKTLFLASGADATVVGSNLKDIDFTNVQKGGELRIAADAGVPASIVGLSASLEASALATGNYDAARKRFGVTLDHLWHNFAASVAHLITVPVGSELWTDTRHIAFLHDAEKDRAEAFQMQAAAANTLIMAGFDPDAIIAAVVAKDLNLLTGAHSGLTSVQLLPPGSSDPSGNGAKTPAPSGQNGGGRQLELLEELLRASTRPKPVEIHNHMPEQAPPEVRFEPGALTVEPADVNVTVEAPPAPEPARVEFAEGAFVTHTTVEAPPAPPPAEVNVRVEPGEAPQVTVEPAQVTVQPRIQVDRPKHGSATAERGEDGELRVTYEDGGTAVAQRDEDGKLRITYQDD